MNNPKSVSATDATTNNMSPLDRYSEGIQEGRKLENKGIAEYIQKIIDFKTMLDRPENKRDIRILEELIKAIQSRNEGSETK